MDLTCSYPCQYYSYEKYWCKWNNTGCPELPAQQPGLQGPGASCNASTRTVVLSFQPLTEEDEGWYWCGVKRNGAFGETIAVRLAVSAGELRGSAGELRAGFTCSPLCPGRALRRSPSPLGCSSSKQKRCHLAALIRAVLPSAFSFAPF